jgi:hypothetical protein
VSRNRRVLSHREFPLNGRVVARLEFLRAGGVNVVGHAGATPAERYAAADWLAAELGCDVETAYTRLWHAENPFERDS